MRVRLKGSSRFSPLGLVPSQVVQLLTTKVRGCSMCGDADFSPCGAGDVAPGVSLVRRCSTPTLRLEYPHVKMVFWITAHMKSSQAVRSWTTSIVELQVQPGGGLEGVHEILVILLGGRADAGAQLVRHPHANAGCVAGLRSRQVVEPPSGSLLEEVLRGLAVDVLEVDAVLGRQSLHSVVQPGAEVEVDGGVEGA